MLRQKVEEVLESVRKGLKSEGGDIELVDLKDGVLYVRLTGACKTCMMSQMTLKNFVEKTIVREIPEITEVREV